MRAGSTGGGGVASSSSKASSSSSASSSSKAGSSKAHSVGYNLAKWMEEEANSTSQHGGDGRFHVPGLRLCFEPMDGTVLCLDTAREHHYSGGMPDGGGFRAGIGFFNKSRVASAMAVVARNSAEMAAGAHGNRHLKQLLTQRAVQRGREAQ